CIFAYYFLFFFFFFQAEDGIRDFHVTGVQTCALPILARGMDVDLPLVQRAFFYMPLQHSERREDQIRSVELFEQLHATGKGPVKELLKGFLDYAHDHLQVIERFGRFPHRNAVLKRPSTEAEIAYLDGGAPRYGQ